MKPSPNAVDAFMQQLQHGRKAEVEALRALIGAAVPGLSERIKWNAPSYGPGSDDRITMRLQPGDRVQIVLHRGAKPKTLAGFSFDDPAGLVEWATPDRGVVTIAPGQLDAVAEDLAELLRQWIAATA
jgi:hypothetical protein